MDFLGKKVMVVGVAKSGIASARLLISKGADVVLYDAKTIDEFDSGTFDEFEGIVQFALGVDANSIKVDAMVLSPGVPTALPFIQNAVAQGKTVIGEGTKVDNLVQIAHNVVIGKHCLLIALSGLAGSCKLGNYVTVAAQSGVGGHVELGDQIILAGGSGISKSIKSL